MQKALIIGAGIGGLTAALALAKIGMQVNIFERAPELGEIGAGLQLSPNAMAVLSALGLSAQIEEQSCEPSAGVLRDYRTGKALLTTPMHDIYARRYGHKYFHIHRADLIHILAHSVKAAGVTLHLGHTPTTLQSSETGVTLAINGETFSGDVVVGADGIHSFLREEIIGTSEPQFTGQVAWRGLVPTSKLPPNTLPFAANNWMGPGRHFVSYYVRGGDMINFVAVEERDIWAEERWDSPADLSDLRQAFHGWAPRVTKILNCCDTAYLWGLFDHSPLPQWTKGRMALLGDAAHPMLPFMAQGAAMAIEDGWVLAHSLISRKENVPEALKFYEAIRKPRTTMMQSVSRNNAKLYHARSPLDISMRAAKFKVGAIVPAAIFARLDKIYGVDVTRHFPL